MPGSFRLLLTENGREDKVPAGSETAGPVGPPQRSSKLVGAVQLRTGGQQVTSAGAGGGAPVLLIADDDETKISANIGVNKSKSAV